MNVLDAKTFILMLRGGVERLEAEKARVNALNVFPVPDGDTGTNMALTLQAALRSAEACNSDHLGEVVEAAAKGALLGARGNSGVILSQFFRGLANGLRGVARADTQAIVAALESAAKAAYESVLEPVEGTMLSVGRAGAEAARAAAEGGLELSRVLLAALDGANKMLAKTPLLLSVLREAGVVDAGGKGLVVAAYGSLAALQNGTVAALAEFDKASAETWDGSLNAPVPNAVTNHGITLADDITYTYCTEFLVYGEELDAEKIRLPLLELEGDSLLVVGDNQVVKVHIHTNEPWRILELCAAHGDLGEIRIDNMVRQNQEVAADQRTRSTAGEPLQGEPAADGTVGVVAVVQGEGFEKILRELGVTVFVQGGQSMNPSTQEMLDAVSATKASRVILLPNNRNVILSAEQVAKMSDKEVVVIPSQSIPHAISCMMRFDPELPFEELVAAMRAAAAEIRVGEITEAVRDARLNGHSIRAGQRIGLTDGQIVGVSDALEETAVALVEAMYREDAEIVTLYYGVHVTEDEAERSAEAIRRRFPGLEVEVYSGGQPVYDYLVTVE